MKRFWHILLALRAIAVAQKVLQVRGNTNKIPETCRFASGTRRMSLSVFSKPQRSLTHTHTMTKMPSKGHSLFRVVHPRGGTCIRKRSRPSQKNRQTIVKWVVGVVVFLRIPFSFLMETKGKPTIVSFLLYLFHVILGGLFCEAPSSQTYPQFSRNIKVFRHSPKQKQKTSRSPRRLPNIPQTPFRFLPPATHVSLQRHQVPQPPPFKHCAQSPDAPKRRIAQSAERHRELRGHEEGHEEGGAQHHPPELAELRS